MEFDKGAVRKRLKARADLDDIWLGTSDDDLDDALGRIEALEAALQRITELPMGWWQEPRAVNCGPCADAHGIALEALAATPQPAPTEPAPSGDAEDVESLLERLAAGADTITIEPGEPWEITLENQEGSASAMGATLAAALRALAAQIEWATS